MERRKFLVGMGSLAAGAAAATGTGAFDQVSAERQVNVNVADDSDAYLTLDASGSPYATENGGGEAVISIDSNGDGGKGVNEDATTIILDVLEVQNQGTDPAVVYVNPDSVKIDGIRVASGNTNDYLDPQASSLPNGSGDFTDSPPRGYDALSATAIYIPADGNESVNAPKFKNEADTVFSNGNGAQEFRLGAGESYNLGLFITENGDGTFDNAELDLVADTNIADDPS